MPPTLTTRRVTLHIKQRQHRKHNGKGRIIMSNIIGFGTNPLGGGQTIPDGYCLAYLGPGGGSYDPTYVLNN